MRLPLICALLLVVALPACGDDDGDGGASADAAAPDATPVDAAAPADAKDFCASYCTCMAANCMNQFNNTLGGSEATCLTTCQGLSVTNQECRDYHCSMATGAGASTHCPHSVGIGECQGN